MAVHSLYRASRLGLGSALLLSISVFSGLAQSASASVPGDYLSPVVTGETQSTSCDSDLGCACSFFASPGSCTSGVRDGCSANIQTLDIPVVDVELHILGQLSVTTLANVQSATPDHQPATLGASIDQVWGFTLYDYSEVTITNFLVADASENASYSFEWQFVGGAGSGVSHGYFDSLSNPDFTTAHSIRLAPGTYFIKFKASAHGHSEGTSEFFYNGLVTFDYVTCPADFNGDGVLDFFDMLDFVDAFSNYGDDTTFSNAWKSSGQADVNGDGTVDFFDYLDFVDMFNAGC